MELTPELLSDLSGAARCRPAIAGLAKQLCDLSVEGGSQLVAQLISQGEDIALSRLLNVCVYNDLILDAELLARSVAVVADITDIAYCFKRHDGSAIAPLLSAGTSEEISWQRKSMVLRIAAELAVRYDTAKVEVKLACEMLYQDVSEKSTEMLMIDSLHMLTSAKGSARTL